MAQGLFNYGKGEIIKGNIDLENDTIKVAKMAAAYSPNIDADQFLSDVSASVVGTSQTIATTVTVNNTDDAAYGDAADTNETNQTLTTDMVVFYKDTGTASTSTLIGYADITSDGSTPVTLQPTDGDIDLVFATNGWIKVS